MKDKNEPVFKAELQKTKTKLIPKIYMNSFQIPCDNSETNAFITITTWIPNTPQYHKPPLIGLTFNVFGKKSTIYFDSAFGAVNFFKLIEETLDKHSKTIDKCLVAATEQWKTYQDAGKKALLKHLDKKNGSPCIQIPRNTGTTRIVKISSLTSDHK